MTMKATKPNLYVEKNLRDWIENEIQCNIDGYHNTRKQAIQFVLDLVDEGEYESNRELSPIQNAKAAKWLCKMLNKVE